MLLTAAVGASIATGAGTATTFESGTEPFPNVECPHPAMQFERVTSPVREGRYAARFSVTADDVWANGSVRCMVGNYHSGETVGGDYYYRLSIFIPSAGLSRNLIWELHHPQSLYSISGPCSVAPHALLTDGTRLVYRLFAGNCIGSRYSTQLVVSLPHLNPYPRDVWIDFVFHIKFEESPTGLVEIYYRTGSKRWPAKPLVVRRKVPTMPYSDANDVHGVQLYMMLGLYPGYAGYTGNDSIYIDDVRRETSLAAAERTGGSAAGGGRSPAACSGPFRCGVGVD
jgi:hypothetical protein